MLRREHHFERYFLVYAAAVAAAILTIVPLAVFVLAHRHYRLQAAIEGPFLAVQVGDSLESVSAYLASQGCEVVILSGNERPAIFVQYFRSLHPSLTEFRIKSGMTFHLMESEGTIVDKVPTFE